MRMQRGFSMRQKEDFELSERTGMKYPLSTVTQSLLKSAL